MSAVLDDTSHAQFQSGQEHDVVDAYLSEEFEGTVACQDVESVLADEDAGQDEADDVGDVKAAEQDGRTQDDDKDEEEYPWRVGHQSFLCTQNMDKQKHVYKGHVGFGYKGTKNPGLTGNEETIINNRNRKRYFESTEMKKVGT